MSNIEDPRPFDQSVVEVLDRTLNTVSISSDEGKILAPIINGICVYEVGAGLRAEDMPEEDVIERLMPSFNRCLADDRKGEFSVSITISDADVGDIYEKYKRYATGRALNSDQINEDMYSISILRSKLLSGKISEFRKSIDSSTEPEPKGWRKLLRR